MTYASRIHIDNLTHNTQIATHIKNKMARTFTNLAIVMMLMCAMGVLARNIKDIADDNVDDSEECKFLMSHLVYCQECADRYDSDGCDKYRGCNEDCEDEFGDLVDQNKCKMDNCIPIRDHCYSCSQCDICLHNHYAT